MKDTPVSFGFDELETTQERLRAMRVALREQRAAIKRQSKEIDQLQRIVAQLVSRGRIPADTLESQQEE